MEFEFTVRLFAHAALAFYVLGLLARKDLHLRWLLLAGTGWYILYYYYIADEPLWDAIFASVIIAVANVVSLVRIYLERSTFGFTDDMRALYSHMPTLRPGQFRKIMHSAEWHQSESTVVLTKQGEIPEGLYFVLEGPVLLKKGNREVLIPPQTFIGELSFVRGDTVTANATVTIQAGARYVRWDRAELRRHMDHSLTMANALGALFNRDIADKLSQSWPDR